MTRFMQQAVNYRDQQGLSWSKVYDMRDTGVGSMAKSELDFWANHLQKLNRRYFNPEKKQCKLVFGDAGENGEGAHFDFVEGRQVFHYLYTEEESRESSTFREISSIYDYICQFVSN